MLTIRTAEYTPIRIVARLSTPVIGRLGPLDGPLSWAAAQQALARGQEIPPISDDYAHDFDLPLARWEHPPSIWGWCVSDPILTPAYQSVAEIRRRPAAHAMAIYTEAKEHHNGLGPTKAGNATIPTNYYPEVTWNALVTNLDDLHELLAIVTHIGARHRNYFGHVTQWETTPGPEDGWKERPLPAEPTNPNAFPARPRAPYWHPSERTLCATS